MEIDRRLCVSYIIEGLRACDRNLEKSRRAIPSNNWMPALESLADSVAALRLVVFQMLEREQYSRGSSGCLTFPGLSEYFEQQRKESSDVKQRKT